MARHVFLVALFLIALTGCGGTLEVGLEKTPTPNHAATATIAALVNENARLATLAASRVPTPTPTTPDLGQLAYVQGGDIWVRTLPDGRAQRLTTDGRNRAPRWSYSGQWLAFRKDRQVIVEQGVPCDVPSPRSVSCSEQIASVQEQAWLVGADGIAAHAIVPNAAVQSFAWSPREDRIAYVTLAGELQVVNPDSTGLKTLVSRNSSAANSGRVGRFAWSPDGGSIAYEWIVQQADQPPTYQGIWRVSVDAGNPVEVYSSGTPKRGEALIAGWVPTNAGVLFWQGETRSAPVTEGLPLYTLGFANNGSDADAPARLGREPVLTYTDFVAPAPPGTFWGNRGAAAMVIGIGRSTWKNKRIEIDTTFVTPPEVAAMSPSWSPDGAYLAYAAMPDESKSDIGDATARELMQRHIWIANTQGDPKPRRLTDASFRDERPLWSADGSYILFVRMDIRGRASLWIVPASGGTPRQMVEELTPAPDPLGFFGHIDWDGLFDWWTGRAA